MQREGGGKNENLEEIQVKELMLEFFCLSFHRNEAASEIQGYSPSW